MGAYGYGPFDSDDAQDWLLTLEKPLKKALKLDSNSMEYGKQRAAIEVILMLDCFSYDKPLFRSIKQWLELMLSDNEFIGLWDDKTEVIKDINRQLEMVLKIIEIQKEYK